MIVIFSGYNQRAVVAFLRTLSENRIDDYCIIASAPNDTIFLTDYSNKVYYTRRNKDFLFEEINTVLIRLREQNGILWIAPTTEYINRFFLAKKDYFEKLGCIIPLVNEDKYSLVSDKESFCRLCEEEAISVPSKCSLPSVFETPLIAKPISYSTESKEIYSPIFILSSEQLDEFREKYRTEDFFYQEFLLDGDSVYLLFYFDKHGNYHVYSQRNLAQQFGGKSIIAAVPDASYKKAELTGPYVKMFKKIGFMGIVMVELRIRGNTAYMIEANPRFWGPSQFFCDAGMNFFELMLSDYGLLNGEVSWTEKPDARYFWSGGIEGNMLPEGCVFHGDGEKTVINEKEKFEKSDIYMRDDTAKVYAVENLRQLYMRTSKHSNYQILPDAVAEMLGQNTIVTKSRQEKERMTYILSKLKLHDKEMLDIGGNTGYFSFEAVKNDARHVDYYEGNKDHADFVKLASDILELKDRIGVFNEYYMFEQNEKKYDIVFNLNVVHHLGDDFMEAEDMEKAKSQMLKCVNSLADATEMMVFQIGFNWKGNRDRCLFENGTKREMIDFIRRGTEEYWDIENIGIAEKQADQIVFCDISEKNIERNDSIGEFLNRPIFIMKSKHYK